MMVSIGAQSKYRPTPAETKISTILSAPSNNRGEISNKNLFTISFELCTNNSHSSVVLTSRIEIFDVLTLARQDDIQSWRAK